MHVEAGLLSALVLLLGGGVAGFYGSSAGSGSLVSFPALLLVGIPTQAAIATNRFAIFFGEVASTIQYHRHRKLDVRFAVLLGIIEAVGAVIGSHIVVAIPANALNIIVAVFLLLIPLLIFVKPSLGSHEGTLTDRAKIWLAIAAFPIGIYGGFFGAGFGTILALTLAYGGLSLIQSAAIARMVGIFVSLTAALSFIALHIVLYREGLLLGAGYAMGGWLGAKTSLKRGNQYVRVLLFLIAILSAVKLIWGVV